MFKQCSNIWQENLFGISNFINNNTSNSVATQNNSLTRLTSIVNKREFQVVSGGSSALLAGGAIALGVLGGPITAIIALAVAALSAMIMFITSTFFSKPNVTSVETPKEIEMQETVKEEVVAETTQAPAQETVAEATVTETVAEQSETCPLPTNVAPKATRFQNAKATAQNLYATAMQKAGVAFTSGKNMVASGVNSGVNFVSNHRKAVIGTGAGLVALATGIAAHRAGYTPAVLEFASKAGTTLMNGLNPITGSFSGRAPVVDALGTSPVSAFTAATKAPVCAIPAADVNSLATCRALPRLNLNLITPAVTNGTKLATCPILPKLDLNLFTPAAQVAVNGTQTATAQVFSKALILAS